MTTYIPLISSGCAGPLGVLHLPRFWQKASLDAVGKLDAEYPACGGGYDQMTLDALGLEKDATLAFIQENKPSYTEFEAWVQENATNLEPDAIAKHNSAVTGYNHTDETRREILQSVGLTDGEPKDAVRLNELDDWGAFHRQVIRG